MINYNKVQQFLHDFVLKKKTINKSLYELEKILFLKDLQISNQYHVFICSLPRSGTTSLLNFLFSTGEYASLTYRNMPFILSPNFSKLLNKKNLEKKERMHGDGIFYDLNSPEAFDEFFFSEDEEYLKNELINYLNLICLSQNKQKYLSKNNLNYKRINFIKSLLPNSQFLIPIREPSQHSYSLLKQHKHFCILQERDNFIRRYMNYLSHNEFGLTHKSWKNNNKFKNLSDINYWLEQWYLFYYSLYNNLSQIQYCHFFVYEQLNTNIYSDKFLKIINLNKNKIINPNYFKNSNLTKINLHFDEELLNKSDMLYDKFKTLVKFRFT